MGKTILLADDSLTIQKVVELTFADTDFIVESTSSGDELLEKLPGADPDVIICDTIMPGSDGYLVCQRVKSEPETLHIPVILLTGTFEPFDRDRALAAGCSEIITKPFEARKLVETVERLVSGEVVAAPPSMAPSNGAVAPPDFTAAVPPPSPQEEAEFGTLLAEPLVEEPPVEEPPVAEPAAVEAPVAAPPDAEPLSSEPPLAAPLIADGELDEDGMDFTTTGFAEMQEAGEIESTMPGEVPDVGLDFDLPADEEPFAEPEPVETPPVQAPDPVPEVSDDERTQPLEPFGEPTSADADLPAEFDDTADFSDGDTIIEPARADHAEHPASPADEEDDSFSPADSEPAEVEQPEEPEDSAPGAASEDSADDAATPPPIAAVAAPAQPEAAPAPAGELSDADVDRIARRVVELAADRLEQIAWEVIPDMAEIVVRARVRELEDEVERDSVTSAN